MKLFEFFRRESQSLPVIVVSGLPRSGTSMLMKMLEAGGVEVFTDGFRQADEDNPRGYFELEKVKNLQKQTDRSWMRAARGKAVKVISQLLPELPPEHTYKVLFINRNLHEVIASQNKMLLHRGEKIDPASDERMCGLFEKHLEKTKAWLESSKHFEVLELQYSQVIANPVLEARRIREFLGQNLDADKMAGAVEASLYRNRAKNGDTLGIVS
ncbi:MAG: sulfotransferase family protein [Acidobacteria bacterium]|nr:MAG: sulfotransferase family protein [Acidobacteriota bacterium]